MSKLSVEDFKRECLDRLYANIDPEDPKAKGYKEYTDNFIDKLITEELLNEAYEKLNELSNN